MQDKHNEPLVEDRELITEIDEDWNDDEPMTLEVLQRAITTLREKYGPDAKLDFDTWNGSSVVYQRPPTAQEIAQRRKAEERVAKEAEAIDKAWDKLTKKDREALQLTRKPTPRYYPH